MMIDQLKASLGHCKFSGNSKCVSKSPYELIERERFFVYDPPVEMLQPVKIASDDEDFQLTVLNERKTKVWLVKTDKCLLTDSGRKCDCMLVNDNDCFLVEIKNTSLGGRKNARVKAIEQLGATLELLQEAGVTTEGMNVRAVVCFKTRNSRPIQASTTTKQADFFDKYGVLLAEINQISF